MFALYSLAFALSQICLALEGEISARPRRLAPIPKQWLRAGESSVPLRRIDGRFSGTPTDCCSSCGVGGWDSDQPNIPVAAGYEGERITGPYVVGGRAVLSDEELTSALLCVQGFAGSTTCECRLDVAIYVDFHYMCENVSNEYWRYTGNTVLTGGPYDNLIVDSVSLTVMMAWVNQPFMLWANLFQVTDKEPCSIKNIDDRHIEFVESRFDMGQYNYYFYPNKTITVPSAWSFVTEAEPDDIGWWQFKEVGTLAHIVRGSSP